MEKHRLKHRLISTCGGNVNYKSVHQRIPTCENREDSGNFQNESASSAFNWVLQFYFLKWNCYFSVCQQKFLESTSQFFASIFSATKHNSSILFLAWALYALIKSSLLTCKLLWFSSARVKICQIPHVNFELTSQFLFKFCIILHCHDTKLPYNPLAHKFSTLDKIIPSKSPFLV